MRYKADTSILVVSYV